MRMNRIGDSLARTRTLRQATRNAVFRNGRTVSSVRGSTSSLISNTDKSSSGKSSSSILNALTGKQKKSYYTAIDKYAADLQKHTQAFMADGEDSLFAAAENAAEGSTKEKQAVVDQVNTWIDAYNSMVTNMANAGDAYNAVYLRQLNTYVSTNKSSLKEIGISQNSDGTLSVNQAKLKDAAVKDIKSVFGVKTGFADKVSARAEYIESSAEKNLAELSGTSAAASTNYNSSAVLNEIYAAIGNNYNSKG